MQRRAFVQSSLTAALFAPGMVLPESGLSALRLSPRDLQQGTEGYDGMAKLANNENPWGPPESVMKAMIKA